MTRHSADSLERSLLAAVVAAVFALCAAVATGETRTQPAAHGQEQAKAADPKNDASDAAREWAYDRESSAGKLGVALDEANKSGWVVVDMKDDWKVIYPFERAP